VFLVLCPTSFLPLCPICNNESCLKLSLRYVCHSCHTAISIFSNFKIVAGCVFLLFSRYEINQLHI